MSETPSPTAVTTYADAERALLARWPETRLEPSLDRIEAFTELLGEPLRIKSLSKPGKEKQVKK